MTIWNISALIVVFTLEMSWIWRVVTMVLYCLIFGYFWYWLMVSTEILKNEHERSDDNFRVGGYLNESLDE
jgi:hypothetical protein